MSTPKRQKSSKDVPYELIYWPGIPGRGEHVRLVLEEAGATYTDTAHTEGGIKSVTAQIDDKNVGKIKSSVGLKHVLLNTAKVLSEKRVKRPCLKLSTRVVAYLRVCSRVQENVMN